MLFRVLLVLVGACCTLVDAQAVITQPPAGGGGTPGCTYTWNFLNNSNANGGTPYQNITALATCQAQCITLSSTCKSVDWIPANNGCWLNLNGGTTNVGTYQGAQHYDLVSSCTAGCTYSWNLVPNSNANGGTAYQNITNLQVCQQQCITLAPPCRSIDFVTANNGCWLNLNNGSTNVGTYTGCSHYDLTSSCTGSSSAPGGCTYAWSTGTPNSNVFGGTLVASANTLALCEGACTANSSCTGVDFYPPGPQYCYTIGFASAGLVRNGLASGVTHYDVTSTCSGSCTYSWSTVANTNAYGGTVFTNATTYLLCQAQCIAIAVCRSVDFDPTNACYLNLNNATTNPVGTYVGCTHYDLTRTCTGAAGGTGVTGAGTGATGAGTGSGACTPAWSVGVPNSHVNGGTVNTASTTLIQCQAACQSTTGCTGVDFYPPGTPFCWLITFNSTGLVAAGATGVTHYDISSTCSAVCSQTWAVGIPNSNVAGGTVNSASTTLSACQTVCLSTSGCTGVDFYPPGTPYCWLITFNSTGLVRTGLASGVTHYDIATTCTGGTTGATPGPGGSSGGGSCTPTFSGGTANMHMTGGTANSATSLQACQAACLSTTGCVAIDYYPPGPSFCYIITTMTALSSAPGVTDYQVVNPCSQLYPGLGTTCPFVWSLLRSAAGTGGTAYPAATSEAACKGQCIATTTPTPTPCDGIDWSASTSACTLYFGNNTVSASTTARHWDLQRNASRPCNYFGGCVYIYSYAPTMSLSGGTVASGVTTELACRTGCAVSSACIGADWNYGTSTCTYFTAAGGAGTLTANSNAEHYFLQAPSPLSCLPTCTTQWTQVIGALDSNSGPSPISSTLTNDVACRSACESIPSCIGYDIPLNPPGPCLFNLQGSSIGTNINPNPAYTHSDIIRSPCGSGCSDVWTLFPNTNYIPPTLDSLANSYETCRADCLFNNPALSSTGAGCYGVESTTSQSCFDNNNIASVSLGSGTGTYFSLMRITACF